MFSRAEYAGGAAKVLVSSGLDPEQAATWYEETASADSCLWVEDGKPEVGTMLAPEKVAVFGFVR
jgi:hypothetical protein